MGRLLIASSLAVLFVALLPPPAEADLVTNGSFETPDVADNSFTLSPGPSAVWVFQGNSGIIDAPSAYGAPTPPDGDQVALLQSANVSNLFSNFSQTVSLPASTRYILSFFAAGRSNRAGNLPYNVFIDSTLVYSDATERSQPFTFQSVAFAADAGSHVLRFQTTQDVGDTSAFFDDIRLAPAAVPEPSSVALLGLAMAGLAGYSRRRESRAASCAALLEQVT